MDTPMTRRTFELIAFFAALLLAAMAFHAWLAAHDDQRRVQTTLAAQKQLLDAADARERDRDAALNNTLAQIAKLKSAALSPQQIIRELPQYLPLPQPITLANPSAPAAQPSANSSSPTRAAAGALPSRASPDAPGRGDEESASAGKGTGSFENGRAAQSSSTTTIPIPSSTSSTSSAPATSSNSSTSGSSTSIASSTSSASSASLPSAPAAQIPAADLQPLFDYVQDCRACQAKLAVAQQNAADDAAKITALTRERDAAVTAAKGGSFLRRLRRNALWFGIGAGVGYALARR